jgi:hypothetical protein
MALLSIWANSSGEVLSLSIRQIVAMAGDGRLLDNSECSTELRTFLSEVPSEKLAEYANFCLTDSFDKSGETLQDVVNELGRRLDYNVKNGRYQGVSNKVGNDGLWLSPEGHHLLVEVKTTDAYRVSLDTIAKYRNSLRESSEIDTSSSMLLVVGRKDTGELEAQVRGSRHAWDMRLIGVSSLIDLVRLKENTEDEATGAKMRSILIPMEYTRLDGLVDIIFATAQDIETPLGEELVEEIGTTPVKEKSGWDFTETKLVDKKRDDILNEFARLHKIKLVRKSRATYWTSDRRFRVACTISKRYEEPKNPYWFGYDHKWRDFVKASEQGFFVLGCMDLKLAFAIPADVMETKLPELNTTDNERGMWWHIVIRELKGQCIMVCAKTGHHLDLTPYIFQF